MTAWGLRSRASLSTRLKTFRKKKYFQRTSDTPSTAYGTVLVYDGHPDEGGELIAGKRVFIGSDDPEGAAVWFSWVPPTRGQHLLFAKVLQSANDSAPGGNTATLTVNVIGPVQYLPLILR